MGNKKKRLKKGAVNDDRGNGVPSTSNDRHVSMIQDNIQSVDSFEIKEENDIKQEPVVVGELVDVPASTYSNVTNVSDSNESDGEYDFDFLSLNNVKDEVKKDCDGKKDEDSRTNGDSDEEAVDNQPDQPDHDDVDLVLPESNDNMHSDQKQGVNVNGKSLKKHKCDFCEYSALCKSYLVRHLLKHTGDKPYACNFCPKRYTRSRSLRSHMKVHVEEFLFHCRGCLQGFDEEGEKIQHENICKIRRYECHLCKESFGSVQTNMIKHMRVHSGDRPFECKECFKQFTQESNLNKHIKLHAGLRSFRCSKCREGFPHQEERDAHEEKCNRRIYECYDCHKSFGLKKSNLISHMRTHSDEAQFACQRCAKRFKQKHNLNEHMKIHTKKLPFKCLICRWGFSKDDKRNVHQRNCNGRYYECYLCKKFFHSREASLKGHMHIHSGEKSFQCELCRNTFTRKESLNRHMKSIHTMKC